MVEVRASDKQAPSSGMEQETKPHEADGGGRRVVLLMLKKKGIE